MAFTDQQHATGRHAKWTTQVTDEDPDAQATDAAFREAKNWAALRSFAVRRCPIEATAPRVRALSARGRSYLAALWQLMRK